MGAAQLGVVGVGSQLATPDVPGSGITDRSFFDLANSSANSNTPPNWDRYNLWGVMQGSNGGNASAITPNRIVTIPQWFNRTGKIKTITTLVSSSAAARVVIGIYGNSVDGTVFPNLRLYQSSEATINSSGSGVLLSVNPDYLVGAGQLLHIAIAVADNNLSMLLGIPCADMPGLYGTANFGGSFTATAADFDLLSGLRVNATYGTAPNQLPVQFPTTGISGFGAQQGAGLTTMPAFAFRFLKS